MNDHPLFWLAIATFLMVIALAVWSYISTRRRQKYGSKAKGLGSDADPMG